MNRTQAEAQVERLKKLKPPPEYVGVLGTDKDGNYTECHIIIYHPWEQIESLRLRTIAEVSRFIKQHRKVASSE